MQRYIKIKNIILLVLVLLLGSLTLTYFTGGLKPKRLVFDIMDFSTDGFIDPNTINAELGRDLNPEHLVASNDRFLMFFNEGDTIVTIIDKYSCADSGDLSTCKAVYTSAQTGKVNNQYKSPINIEYQDSSNPTGSIKAMNGYNNSVAFIDKITNEVERHFWFKYIDNEAVQVIYEIGRFGMDETWFPIKITEQQYAQLFTGVTDRNVRNEAQAKLQAGEITQWEYEDIVYSANPFLSREDRISVQSYFMHYNEFQTLLDEYGNPILDEEGNEVQVKILENKGNTSIVLKRLYRVFYGEEEEVDGEIVRYGGFQKFDEDGKPVWLTNDNGEYIDEEGNVLQEGEQRVPVRYFFNRDIAFQHNEKMGIEFDKDFPRFHIGIEYRLGVNGLEATIIRNSIKEGADFDAPYQLTSIDLLPHMTTVSRTESEEGFMVIPDGSGAIIKFNNNKTSYASYLKPIYGADKASYPELRPEVEQQIALPMYGFIDQTNQKGVLAIVEKGAAVSRIAADIPRANSEFNRIRFTTALRSSEIVTVGTGYSAQRFTKWSDNIPQTDYKYRYYFLAEDELDYVGLAKKYREYLMEKYDLKVNDKSNQLQTNINFIGAFDEYDLFLGFKYRKQSSLTTFNEAKTILEELQSLGVGGLNVSYTSWTDEGLEVELGKKTKVSKVLGGEKGFNQLVSFLEGGNINFYPEINIGTTKGFDYKFGKNKFTSKSVSLNQAIHYPYNLATLEPDKKLNPVYYLSPVFYLDATKTLLNSHKKINANSYLINDLGNYKLSDNTKKYSTNSEQGLTYQTATLTYIQDQNKQMMLRNPFEYSLAHANFAIDVPMESSLYGIFDETIPFYQLVVGGIFDYATVSINQNYQDRDQLMLKLIETGSNLNYDLTFENPEILLNTDYKMYFYTFYENWLESIASVYEEINNLGIHSGVLIDHKILQSQVVLVTYSNGIEVLVNKSLNPYTYDGAIIPAGSYMKVKG